VARALTEETPLKRTVFSLETKELAESANSRQGVQPLLIT